MSSDVGGCGVLECGAIEGDVFVVSAPSGAGKTTLLRAVFDTYPEVTAGIGYSVSHTTRPPRSTEVDGANYHFVDEAAFRHLIAEDGFHEWAEVHGHLYGTSCAAVETVRASGRDVILEIDIQGAEQIRRRVPSAVSIFVLPPSFEILTSRLVGRGSEDPDQIARRLRNAEGELRAVEGYDYVIVNDSLREAARALAAIFFARRSLRHRMRPSIDRVLATVPVVS